MTLLLALDPSLTSTGYVLVDLSSDTLVMAGVIRTAKAKSSERLLAAEDYARRGRAIFRQVRALGLCPAPLLQVGVAAMEANAGSKSAKAAMALARAQQACVDALEAAELTPIFVTPQRVKKMAAGRMDASKPLVKAAMRKRWSVDRWDELLADIPGSKHEHAYDAGAVANAVWDEPAVRSWRRMEIA